MGSNLMTVIIGPLDDGSPLRVRVVNRPFIKIVSPINTLVGLNVRS